MRFRIGTLLWMLKQSSRTLASDWRFPIRSSKISIQMRGRRRSREKTGQKTWHESIKNTWIRRIKSEKNLVFFFSPLHEHRTCTIKHRTFVFHIGRNSVGKSLFVRIHIDTMNFFENDALHCNIRFDSRFVPRFAQR